MDTRQHIFKTIFFITIISLVCLQPIAWGKKSLPIVKRKKAPHTIAKEFYPASLLTNKYASWGISPFNKHSSINLLNAWKKLKKGKKEIIVAVVDTGIDPEHSFLHNNLYSDSGKISKEHFGIDFSKDKNNKTNKKFKKNKKNKFRPIDKHGHGTHVAGIIKSVFPGVKLLILKYFNPNATGKDNLNSTIEALKYAVHAKVDIINYSGGGPEPDLEELRVLKLAEKKNILVVAAAGNEESNIDIKKSAYYPASYGLSNIITISAHDQNLNILGSSNYGKHSVDIFAPGHRIKSTLPHQRAGYLTGTSQATAFVTGIAAMIKSQHPQATALELRKIINSSAKEEVKFFDKCKTSGRADAEKALIEANKYFKNNNHSKRSLANKYKRLKKHGKIRYRISK